MRVLALDRKPRINPILFAFGIVADVDITKRRQFTGGVL
jgi:hypothetical protein